MAVLRSVSSAQSTSATYTVAKPPGTTAGDLLVAFQTCTALFLTDMPAPTGGLTWQLLGQLGDDTWVGTRVWWKIAGPAEPAAYTFRHEPNPFAGTRDGIAGIAAISDHGGQTPLIASLANGDDKTIAAPSLSPTLPAGVTLRWAAALENFGGSLLPPAGHVQQFERSGPRANALLASRTRTLPGSTGTATITWSGPFTPTNSHGFTVDVGGIPLPEPEPEPSIPPSKDIHYKFKFTDLLTGDFIGYLDLSDVSYDRRIGEPGTLSATIDISSAATAEKVASIIPRYPEDLSTGPGRTVCHVYRNGLIWGSYLIWQASIATSDRSGLQARISGATLESYLDHVEIREDLDYVGEDQVNIARALIESMQAQTFANIGLTLESGTSGVTRDMTYPAGESASYGSKLSDLSQLDDGFEWIIQSSDPGTGAITLQWQFGYPRLGNSATEHLFAQPGNVISWQEDIDALRGGTSIVVRGESANTDASTTSGPTLSTPHDATAHLAAGWPRLDATITAHFQRDVATLDDYAARWVARNAGTVRVHQVTIRLDGDDFTPANLGDQARVVLVNNWWPRINGGASFDRSWRVIGISVQATVRGQRETAQLVFEEVAEP